MVTKQPDNGNTVYSENHDYVEQDTCYEHGNETKHGGDWFEI